MRAVYATVERVMRAADVKASAYLQDEILQALLSSSQSVDNLVQLGDEIRPAFAPWSGTITFDWPVSNNEDAYRFWLNNLRLNSLSAIVSGGNDIASIALPWPASGAPYRAIDINTAGDGSLEIASSGTGQRSLAIGGIWGTLGGDRSRSDWTLSGSVSASASALTLNAPIGVGSLVLIGSERMMIVDRSWVDSGQTASALTSNMAAQSVTVTSGSAFFKGEEIIIDSERLLIRDIVGNVLTVQRAAGGSALAAHNNGAAAYWARSCTVDRGALGTTAASHASGALISIYSPPSVVEQLTVAYAIDQRAQEQAGYARSLSHIRDQRQFGQHGSETAAMGIPALEDRVMAAYGRIRHRAI
jgi:hypothetical protein